MPFNFQFRTIDSVRDLQQLTQFLLLQHLNYPHYEDWVERTSSEIDSGYKTPILAFSEGTLVGDLIYQPHKQLPRIRELKNLRIHPEMRRRDFAHFMLRQAEENDRSSYDAIVCDVRTSQRDVMNLLRFSGYTPIGQANLYGSEAEDVVFIKTFDETSEYGIVHSARNLILG